MAVQLLTGNGLPIAGSEVSVILLADKESHAELGGELRAHTDANGTASLDLFFKTGRSGNYSLLLASESILATLSQPQGGQEAHSGTRKW